MIDKESGTPPWQQVAAIIRQRVIDGTYPPGTKIPSALALSGEFAVNRATITKAVNQLKAEGVLTAVAGWGTSVAGK
jgi:DNA-binding GntR family transcriptional regulator